MPTWQRAYLAACAGVSAYCLAYTAVDYLRLPRLYYYPHQRLWRFEARGGDPIASGYVGLWTWALAVGLVFAAVTLVVAGRSRGPVGRRGLGLASAWTVTAFLLASAYAAWHNWP